MIYTIIKSIQNVIEGTPRRLVMYGLVWILLACISSLLVLGYYTPFNPISGIFFGIGAGLMVWSLLKYLLWQRRGWKHTLPDGGILLRLDHSFGSQTRSRPLLGVRETTTQYGIQPLVITPPASGFELIRVKCLHCEQEAEVRVDSRQQRFKNNLRITLILLLMLASGLALNILFSDLVQTTPVPGWMPWMRFIGGVLVFIAFTGLAINLGYSGVYLTKLFPGHKIIHPEASDIARFQRSDAWRLLKEKVISLTSS